MTPKPQPRPLLEPVSRGPSIATGLLNPSIMLMNSDGNIRLLLARNTVIGRQAIFLHGVRLITLPAGFRLALTRLISRIYPMRLPDEYEFQMVQIDCSSSPTMAWSQERAVGRVEDAETIIHLSGNEYIALSKMSGRLLHRWIVERFGLNSSTKHRRKSAA